MYVIHLYEIQAAYNKKVDLIFASFYIKRKGYLLEMTKKYFPWGKKKKNVFPLYPLLLLSNTDGKKKSHKEMVVLLTLT